MSQDKPPLKLTIFNAPMKTFLTKENQINLFDDVEELEDFILSSKCITFSYTEDLIITTMALSQDDSETDDSATTASNKKASATSAST